MSHLFQILTLGAKGKTAMLGVKANSVPQAMAAAVAYTADKPAVVLAVVSEHLL